jgi:PPOX class probable F420-dependent enzyme
VKRVQNNPKVRLAPCDVRGKLRGDWVDGTCVVITDKAHEKRAHDAFRKKYGITALFADIGATISGGVKHRTWLEITLTGS